MERARKTLEEGLQFVKEQLDVCPVCGSELTEKGTRPVAFYGDYDEVEVEMAKLVRVREQPGKTEEEARNRVIAASKGLRRK